MPRRTVRTPRLRWSPGVPRTVRDGSALQLGVGPGARVLEGLGAVEWDVVERIGRQPSRADLLAAVTGQHDGPGRAGRLLDLLEHAGVLVADGYDSLSGSGGAGGAAGVEAPDRVAVVGGAGLGAVLAVAFAATGARVSALVDDATIGAADVLPGGATRADLGRRAHHAAAEAVHRHDPDVRTGCPPDPDLVVLVSRHVPDAVAAMPLVQAGTTHLPVVVRAEDVVVGPLVVPGAGACLHCVDLHHRDLDPGWPDAVRLLRRDAGRVRPPDPAVVAAVAGCATRLGARAGDAAGAEARVAVASLLTSWHRWRPHPACGCVGLPGPGPVDGADDGGATMVA